MFCGLGELERTRFRKKKKEKKGKKKEKKKEKNFPSALLQIYRVLASFVDRFLRQTFGAVFGS